MNKNGTLNLAIGEVRLKLAKISQNLPQFLTKELFSTALFRCQSEYMADYVQEIEGNLYKVQTLSVGSQQHEWLLELVDQQIKALVQTAMRGKNVKSYSAAPATAVNQRAKLEQELARHLEYERRLQDNLREAQGASNGLASSNNEQAKDHQALVLKCQQRLLRCQRAIADIEKRLEKHLNQTD